MFTSDAQSLEIASRVLSKDDLLALVRLGVNKRGRLILDRWALDSSVRLRAWSEQGLVKLKDRILEQQEIEGHAIETYVAEHGTALADHEILALREIATQLEEPAALGSPWPHELCKGKAQNTALTSLNMLEVPEQVRLSARDSTFFVEALAVSSPEPTATLRRAFARRQILLQKGD